MARSSHKKHRKVPERLRPMLQQFSQELTKARDDQARRQEGATSAEPVDLSRAIQVLQSYAPELHRYPSLLTNLEGITERAFARESALTADNFTTKRSPTASTPQAGYVSGGWAGNKNQPVGVLNAGVLRAWADSSEWVRAAINIRRQQVGRAEMAIIPEDERKPYNKAVAKQVKLLLSQPNLQRDSWRSLIEPVLEDLLVLDRGVISKNMKMKPRVPVELFYEDGASIKIFPDWSGDPQQPHYLYEEPGSQRKVPLFNDEAIVIMANPASYRFGLSPVQVLARTIQADLKATQAAIHLVEMKPPPHAIQIPNASSSSLRSLRDAYESDIAGQKELFFFGGDQPAHLFPLVFNARENQWLEWQEYLARKIATVFQLSPQQLGITQDVNRATATTQQSIYEDTGLIPLLLLLEEYLNREMLFDFAPTLPDGRANTDALNLRVSFPEITEASRILHIESVIAMIVQGLGQLPVLTPNMALALLGEEPIPHGDTLYVKTANGAVPWLSYDTDFALYPTDVNKPLGEPDPAGGPTDDDEPTPPKDNGTGPQPNLDNGANGPNGGNAAGGDSAQGAGPAPTAGPASVPTGKGSPRFHRGSVEVRPAGKRWYPGMRRQEPDHE